MLSDENIYQLLFQNIKEGIIITDDKGIIVKINHRLGEIFGYSSEELVGQRLEMLVPMNKRGGHSAHHSSFMNNPKSRSMGQGLTLKGCRKDNSEVALEISLSYFSQEDKKFAIGLVSDISKRVDSENEILQLNSELEIKVEQRTKELRDSQKLYQLIARNFPEGTINVFDRNLNYIFVEGEELYSLGITSEKLLGTSYLDRLPESLHEEIQTNLDAVFKGEGVKFMVTVKESHYQIISVPLVSDDNKIEQILVVERNVTQQQNLNDQVLDALEKERALNELKTRFVSMASHEFRTPLSAILSSSDLVRKYIERNDLSKTEKHLNRIQNSVHNLIDILSDFLSIDEMDSNKVQFNPKLHHIKDFMSKLTIDLEAILKKEQSFQLKYELSQEEYSFDYRMLRNVLNNLITNAIKYSGEGSIIDVSVKEDKGVLKFEVRDYGIGIPTKDQKNLFDRFFRAENAENIQGTGLGLYIVQRYINSMGGKITFESIENEGTCFFIEINMK